MNNKQNETQSVTQSIEARRAPTPTAAPSPGSTAPVEQGATTQSVTDSATDLSAPRAGSSDPSFVRPSAEKRSPKKKAKKLKNGRRTKGAKSPKPKAPP